MRFPSLYASLAQAGAELIFVPSAFTKPTGEAHWEALLRARAIETGAFVVAPAQGGRHEDGRTTFGHSLIVEPWGSVAAKLDHDEPGLLVADLDLDRVAEARAKIPAWRGGGAFTPP
jgi:predicted amidohydrolase